MKLIYHRGLNCYHSSIVTAAAALGAEYERAYAHLWSERDFRYDEQYDVDLSIRIDEGYMNAGIHISKLPCGCHEEAQKSICQLRDSELFAVGMDMLHIPWSEVYGHFSSPHYFVARNAHIVQKDGLECYDPVYGMLDVRITKGEIIEHAYDLVRFTIFPSGNDANAAAEEAAAVLHQHPAVLDDLLCDLEGCASGDRHSVYTLLRKIEAMICNRNLFFRFLHSPHLAQKGAELFDEALLFQWEAIKNGLYKIMILRGDTKTYEAVVTLCREIFDREMEIARQILHVL